MDWGGWQVSHLPAEECAHTWENWEEQERKMFTSSDDIIVRLVRRCVRCGLVDEGS